MGTTKPKMVEFMPLVDRLERHLTTSSSFLAYGARLQANCFLLVINAYLLSLFTGYSRRDFEAS
jgi:hypothetical protein